MLFIGLIAGFAIFAWIQNKHDNRSVDRHNRLLEKQEELMRALKDKKENNPDKDES
ncbi:MAG: hypothetical protein QM791_00750 [Ferruginibacter sp.]